MLGKALPKLVLIYHNGRSFVLARGNSATGLLINMRCYSALQDCPHPLRKRRFREILVRIPAIVTQSRPASKRGLKEYIEILMKSVAKYQLGFTSAENSRLATRHLSSSSCTTLPAFRSQYRSSSDTMTHTPCNGHAQPYKGFPTLTKIATTTSKARSPPWHAQHFL